MRNSLRARLITVYLVLIIVGFGGLTLLAGRQIAVSAYDDYGNNLHIYALLLANQIPPLLEENPQNAVKLIQDYATDLDAQITVFDNRGQIGLRSDDQPVTLVASDSFTIQRNPAGQETMYAVAPIMDEDGQIGTVQIGVATAVPQAIVRQRWLALGIGFVLFSVFGLAISLWLLTSLTRPLAGLQQTALKMADGDLTQRVNPLTNDEIGDVGQAFNTMAERIEAMVAEQRAFAGNASHELRTPLTTVRLRTEWLQSGELDSATAQQYIAEIDSETRRMSRLVEDLLLLSRLDAKNLAQGDAQIDLSRLLRLLQQEFVSITQTKAITLTFDPPTMVLPPIQATLSHVRLVVSNLLDNAIKYTPEGGQVTLSLRQVNQQAQIRVIDDGQGIAANDLPHISKRFYRADKAHSRQIEGTGLGLALVYSVLDLYGGTIEIESRGLNEGTAVTVYWPLMMDV